MADIIRQLPDAVANQIAAGEVIQRPASAVKELLENAIDSGADSIHLIIKDAGKALIQVIDNGCGMSAGDARMCFERHATSKISSAQDLFRIRTMGFRGEAMASIASISQVELRTRLAENELGTLIRIEGSELREQSPEACPAGTSISVKNIFFNVPARRNFLKSATAETRHILDEFNRIALAFPGLRFELTENGTTRYQLPPGSLRDRVTRLFGKQMKEGLVEVNSETSILKVHGFVGKPAVSRKTRGEQFFLVNRRFIRHPYLHHAVENSFDGLLPEGSFPSYFLFLDIDPERIDINIHPTKAEVNFQDAKTIYNLLRSAVRESLGKFSITPTLEFEQEPSMEVPYDRQKQPPVPPRININPDYNPFREQPGIQREWQKAFETEVPPPSVSQGDLLGEQAGDGAEEGSQALMHLHGRYIICAVKSGLMVIDHHRAHQRILYERFLAALESGTGLSQQELFPQTIHLSPHDASLLSELLPGFQLLGFDLSPFGEHAFVVNGTPAGYSGDDPSAMIEGALEQYKKDMSDPKASTHTRLAASMASRMALPYGKGLGPEEMQHLVNELFACALPDISPGGKTVITIFRQEDLAARFGE